MLNEYCLIKGDKSSYRWVPSARLLLQHGSIPSTCRKERCCSKRHRWQWIVVPELTCKPWPSGGKWPNWPMLSPFKSNKSLVWESSWNDAFSYCNQFTGTLYPGSAASWCSYFRGLFNVKVNPFKTALILFNQ